ncbi:MAG: lamin tail domain-containing protein [bacterium]|nr:lamin tail domain-containing protein [bacterium]
MRRLFSMLIFISLILSTPLVYSDIIITEVAPSGGGGFPYDWVEIQNTGTLAQDLTGWALGDLDPDGIPETRRFDFPGITLGVNERAVIHFTNGLSDSTINDNNPGYWDLYVISTEDDLPIEFETLVIFNNSDTIVDAVIYQLSNSSYYDSDVNTIENAGEWIRFPTEDQEEENIYFDPFVKYAEGSGFRRISGTDTDSSMDWAPVTKDQMTPGGDNLSTLIGDKFELSQNYPNPYLPSEYPVTKIKLSISETAKIKLKIYDINGALIKILLEDETLEPGQYIYSWDGTNDKGKEVQSGTFMIMATDGSKTKIKKMTILR